MAQNLASGDPGRISSQHRVCQSAGTGTVDNNNGVDEDMGEGSNIMGALDMLGIDRETSKWLIGIGSSEEK